MRTLLIATLSMLVAACAYDPLGVDSGGRRGNAGIESDFEIEDDCATGDCASLDNSGCATSGDCPDEEVCTDAGQCVAACKAGSDCNAPQLCHPVKRVCETCSSTNPCPTGNKCVEEVCVASCSEESCQAELGVDAFCNEAGKCVGNDCTDHPMCPPERICDLSALRCVSANACVNDKLAQCQSDCQSRSRTCDEETCSCGDLVPCQNDSYCSGVGQICDLASKKCVAPDACVNAARTNCDTRCQGQNLVCDPSSCTCTGTAAGGESCGRDSDCLPGLVCLESSLKCIPNPASCAQFGTWFAALGLLALVLPRRRLVSNPAASDSP